MTKKPVIEEPNDDPLVSVIMNGYNCGKYLEQSINSVFSQTYQNWEIIFWDNASTDDTQSIARNYGPKLCYFRSNRNTSLGAARNSALQQARGEFIGFLDTDDWWLPGKLMQQVQLFRENPEVDFIYTNAYVLNESSGHTTLAARKSQPTGDVFKKFLRHYPVNLQTVLIRSSALFKLDEFFDPKLEVSEEYDLFMRLVLRSKAGYIHEPSVTYRVHDQMSSLRCIEKFPIENRYILDKLRATIENFDDLYSKEISHLNAKIGYWSAKAYMCNRKKEMARNSLRPYLWNSPVFLFLFFASFLPYKLWNILQNARKYYSYLF